MHTDRFSRALEALALASALAVGCGGIVESEVSDASVVAADAKVDASEIVDGTSRCNVSCFEPEDAGLEDALNVVSMVSDGPSPSTCPVQEPEAGAGCDTTTACAYAVDAGCARAYFCDSRQFRMETECSMPQGAGCPATAAGLPPGQVCDVSLGPCGYPGTVCQCVSRPNAADASTTWFCIAIDADCPQIAPLAGTPCSPSGHECSYGANQCAARGFGSFICRSGAWDLAPPPPCR